VETGVQKSCKYLKELDSGFRRNDGKSKIQTFYATINLENLNFLYFQDRFPQDQIFRGCNFDIEPISPDHFDLEPQPLDEGGIIRPVKFLRPGLFICLEEQRMHESLGRLDFPEMLPVQCLPNTSVWGNFLNGITDRNGRHYGFPDPGLFDDSSNQFYGHKWSRAIMDQNDIRLMVERLQANINRVLSFLSPRNDADNFLEAKVADNSLGFPDSSFIRDQKHDFLDLRTKFEFSQGMGEKGNPAHGDKGFGRILGHSLSPACSRDQGGYTHPFPSPKNLILCRTAEPSRKLRRPLQENPESHLEILGFPFPETFFQ
jgi:hypothetical protein